MKTISVAVSEKHYELFREEAKRQNRSIASLIREAMALHAERASGSAVDINSGKSDIAGALLPGPGKYNIYAEVSEAE